MIRIPAFLIPERVSILLFSELALSFACFLAGAVITAGPAAFTGGGLLRITVASFSIIFACYLNGLYRNFHWRSRVFLILHLCSVFGIALLIQGLVAYAGIGVDMPRMAMLAGAAMNFVLMTIWRISYAKLVNRVFASERVLFLGVSDTTREIAAGMVGRPELGYTVAGFLSDGHDLGEQIEGAYVIGGFDAIREAIQSSRAKHVVVDEQEMRQQLPVADLTWARRRGVTMHDAGSIFETVCRRVCSRTFRPSQIIFANEMAQRPNSLALQSIYTNVVALVAYVATLPVLGIAALAIRVTSRGPAFITEQYAGFNGIPFAGSRFRCTVHSDPTRVTRVGALIRALHLEYLPRVINLIRGEVALVGPEPQRIEFAEALSAVIPFHRQREVVKPGITGWTQIQDAPGAVTDALRDIECDLYYTKHFSLPLDAYIILNTIRAILPFQER